MHIRIKAVFKSALTVAALSGACADVECATNWNVARTNHMLLPPPGVGVVLEMSGVTYIGPAGANHRFIAVEETHQTLAQFDLSFDAGGAITGISNVTSISMTFSADFEGVAYNNSDPARNSVFMSEESDPGIREINLTTRASLQFLSPPTVFSANKRPNLGFESLARTPDGTVMWTANEQALTVDGGVSTSSTGTVVRLLRYDVAGNVVTAGAQFAYVTAPIHGSSSVGSPQNGLCDLVAMPDGTLLTLERSVALDTPIYLNRIFETGFAGATDVSQGALANGLSGQSYTPASKQLLWSGAADASAGQNMEGLCLGPRLANGSYVLVGVVDDGFNGTSDTDPQSNNTIVAFLATSNPTADFNASGRADAADFLAWQRGFGKTVGAKLSDGDADRDGDVDGADLTLWKAASAAPATNPTPEPSSAALAIIAAAAAQMIRRRDRSHSGLKLTAEC